MAVPPIQRSPRPADLRHPWVLDTVLGLLVVAALPLAIVTIPNTLSVVAKLLPGDIDQVGLMRTHGLALPTLMLAVPLAAVALRRVKAVHLMLGGLALVALSDAAGGYAASELVVGAVRVLRGIGAGVIMPATLAAVWNRAPVLRALWAGVFSLSLLAAQAFALWPLDEVSSWKVTLQPYPLVTGVALALAAVYLLAWTLLGRPAEPRLHVRDRSRLLLAAVPAAGIAVVGISTATEGWRAIPVIMLAATAIIGLLALASIGTGESRTLA
jgi:MFS family permease